MKTVEDLGRKIKAEHPGAYDDMSDIELGRRVKAAYSSKYDDYHEVAIEYIPPQPLSPPVIAAIQQHYNPRQGLFSTRWKTVRAEERNKLLTALNQEQQQIVRQALSLHEMVIAGRKQEAEFQQYVENNLLILESARIRLSLENKAFEQGFTLSTYEEKLRAEVEVWREGELKRIEHETEQKKAALAREMAKVKMMPDTVKMNELHRQLSETHREIEQAEQITNVTRREAERQRLQKKAAYLHQQIDQLAEKGQGFKFSDGRRN